MTLLVIGVLLFACVPLSKALAPSFRADMQRRLGENAYKGIFSLLILGSIGLIVVGWRSTVPQYLYNTSTAMQAPAFFLLVVAFWLMVAECRSAACFIITSRSMISRRAHTQPTLKPGDSVLEKVPQ